MSDYEPTGQNGLIALHFCTTSTEIFLSAHTTPHSILTGVRELNEDGSTIISVQAHHPYHPTELVPTLISLLARDEIIVGWWVNVAGGAVGGEEDAVAQSVATWVTAGVCKAVKYISLRKRNTTLYKDIRNFVKRANQANSGTEQKETEEIVEGSGKDKKEEAEITSKDKMEVDEPTIDTENKPLDSEEDGKTTNEDKPKDASETKNPAEDANEEDGDKEGDTQAEQPEGKRRKVDDKEPSSSTEATSDNNNVKEIQSTTNVESKPESELDDSLLDRETISRLIDELTHIVRSLIGIVNLQGSTSAGTTLSYAYINPYVHLEDIAVHFDNVPCVEDFETVDPSGTNGISSSRRSSDFDIPDHGELRLQDATTVAKAVSSRANRLISGSKNPRLRVKPQRGQNGHQQQHHHVESRSVVGVRSRSVVDPEIRPEASAGVGVVNVPREYIQVWSGAGGLYAHQSSRAALDGVYSANVVHVANSAHAIGSSHPTTAETDTRAAVARLHAHTQRFKGQAADFDVLWRALESLKHISAQDIVEALANLAKKAEKPADEKPADEGTSEPVKDNSKDNSKDEEPAEETEEKGDDQQEEVVEDEEEEEDEKEAGEANDDETAATKKDSADDTATDPPE